MIKAVGKRQNNITSSSIHTCAAIAFGMDASLQPKIAGPRHVLRARNLSGISTPPKNSCDPLIFLLALLHPYSSSFLAIITFIPGPQLHSYFEFSGPPNKELGPCARLSPLVGRMILECYVRVRILDKKRQTSGISRRMQYCCRLPWHISHLSVLRFWHSSPGRCLWGAQYTHSL